MGDVIDLATRRQRDEPPKMRIIIGTMEGDDLVYIAISEITGNEEEDGFTFGMSAAEATDLAKKLRKTAKSVSG